MSFRLLENSTFQSFERMLCINDIQLRSSEKRTAEVVFGRKPETSNNSGGGFANNSSIEAKSTAPKWFKKL